MYAESWEKRNVLVKFLRHFIPAVRGKSKTREDPVVHVSASLLIAPESLL